MVCGICMYVREGQAAEAITVIEGYAVCEDHMIIVAKGSSFARVRHEGYTLERELAVFRG